MKTPLRLVSEGHGAQVAALAALERGEAAPGLLTCPWDEVAASLKRAEPGFSVATEQAVLALLLRHPDDRAVVWAAQHPLTTQAVRLPAEACAEFCRRALAAEQEEDAHLSWTIWNAMALAAEFLPDPLFYRVASSIPADYLGFLAERVPSVHAAKDAEERRRFSCRLRAVIRVAFRRKAAGEGWDRRLEKRFNEHFHLFRGRLWWDQIAALENEELAAKAMRRHLPRVYDRYGRDVQMYRRALRTATLILPRASLRLPSLLVEEAMWTTVPADGPSLVAIARMVAAGANAGDEGVAETFLKLAGDIGILQRAAGLLKNVLGASATLGGLLRGASADDLHRFLMKDEDLVYKYAVMGALRERRADEWEGMSHGDLPPNRTGMRWLWRQIRERAERHPAFGVYGAMCGLCLSDLLGAWAKLEARGYVAHQVVDPASLGTTLKEVGVAAKDIHLEAYALGSGQVLHVRMERGGRVMVAKIARQEVIGFYVVGELPEAEVKDAREALVDAGLAMASG